MIVRQYAPCSLGRSIICLGKQGEINALRVEFDVSAWMAMYPDATVKLMHFAPDRPQDNPVIPTLGVEGTLRVWIVGEEDTAGAGNGVIELLLIDERTGSTIKSATGYTTVLRSPSAGIEAQEAEAGYVRYDVDQSALLTDEQKAVARKNIGAGTGDGTGSGGILKETDPTVPDWAKQPRKPTYTANEVGALPSSYTPPVTSVNGKTGAVALSAKDVGARPETWMPSASDVGADASGTASGAVAAHNTSGAAHADLRALIEGLTNRLNALADSDDTTLDQLSEIVAYIKSNKSLIDAVTTGKVSTSDIVDNLTTNASGKVLSAAQGVALKAMIDGIIIPTALPNPQPITINGQRYDGSEAVTVTVSSEGVGTPVEIDDTLTQSGKAADAKAVGDQLSALNRANATQDTRMDAIEKTVAAIPGSETSLQAFIDNTDIDYAYDADTGANYTVIRIYKNKLDGTKQFPFVYAPNGAGAGTKSTYDMTVDDGWLLAINAGVFNASTKKPDGIVVQNGVVVQNGATQTHSENKPLTIDANGNLGYAAYNADAADLVSNGIVSAVAGFMPILIDYEAVPESGWNSVSHYTENAQRQIIGQFGNGDYAIITCEGRGFDNSDGWTIAEAQAVCAKLGLKFAYNLDGGGSTETMIGHKHINTIYENTTGRVVPTFIVFNGGTNAPEYDGDIKPDEPTITLTGISATYNGGDVEVGTALTALTGIVVTATYSDGSTEMVTGYTLAGEIVEGSNTITVSYGGMMATFTVIGVANGLPEGYTAVDYIASDGNAYTDNLYTPTVNTGFEYAYLVNEPSVAANAPHVLAGTNFFAPMIQRGANSFFANRCGAELTGVSASLVMGIKYTVKAFINDNTAALYNKGELLASGTLAAGTATPGALRLFGYSESLGYNLKGRIYYLKIYESGMLVRDYVPCIDNNGVAGLYEKINGTFHTSSTNTAYTRGILCTGIVLDQTTLTFDGAGTQTITATVTPSDTTDMVVWSSDDSAIASVSGGVVTAKANGSATITATCGAYSATCAVVVSGVGSGDTEETSWVFLKNTAVSARILDLNYTARMAMVAEGDWCEFTYTNGTQNTSYSPIPVPEGTTQITLVAPELYGGLALYDCSSGKPSRTVDVGWSTIGGWTYTLPKDKVCTHFTINYKNQAQTTLANYDTSRISVTFS